MYCMNVSHTIPDNIKHFQQVEPRPNIMLIIQTGDLKFASGDYISPVGHQKFLISSPNIAENLKEILKAYRGPMSNPMKFTSG